MLRGIFKMNRISFGITVATRVCQKIVEQTLQTLDSTVCFLNDVVVGGEMEQKHNENLADYKMQDSHDVETNVNSLSKK